MPCLLAILIVMFPRVAIVLLYLFTNFFRGVYDTILVPVLGFIFLPLTLVAYTYLTKENQPVDAFYLVVMFLAVVLDLGLVGREAPGTGISNVPLTPHNLTLNSLKSEALPFWNPTSVWCIQYGDGSICTSRADQIQEFWP